MDAYDGGSVVPSIQKMRERFQATITHLRENISSAIESDLRDFGGSSHLPYQGLRALCKGGTEVAWRERWSCGQVNSCQKQISPSVYPTLG
jgi:hypothetical protein